MSKLNRTIVCRGGASYLTPSRILGRIQGEKRFLLFSRTAKLNFFNECLDTWSIEKSL